MARYLCGKIGKSVKFNPKSWGPIGGDNEAPLLLTKMARLNPDDEFIIITKNDIDRHREAMNLPSNLKSVYEGASVKESKDINYVYDKLKDVKVDGCFLISGPTANVNIPNKSFKRLDLKKGEKNFAKSLETFVNYVAPVHIFLNETMIPWVMIANDIRYMTLGNDLMNFPKRILTQANQTIGYKMFDSWETQNFIYDQIDAEYAHMDKICLIDKEIEQVEKTKKFMIVLNEGKNGIKSRYKPLKDYVLDYVKDVEIYGEWNPETIGDDPRFKGSIDFPVLQEMIKEVKYTFVVPAIPNWVTSKWAEMVAARVIPFLHPEYDVARHAPLPDFVRIKSPQDLYQKIEYLENNPEEYERILQECMNSLTEDDFNGKRLNDIILSAVQSL